MTRADRLLIFLVLLVLPLLYYFLWFGNTQAEYLLVRSGSNPPLTEMLAPDRKLHIDGPLGESIIEISAGRTRFISSPCLNQVCVHSGWLSKAGDIAACLPNRVSLTLLGRHPRFDTINF